MPNNIDFLRLDTGDDSVSVPSGVGSHELLSASHSDVTPSTATSWQLIVSQNGLWGAFPSGVENSLLWTRSGQVQWIPTTLPTGNIPAGVTSTTDNAIVRWDGTNGQNLQNSFVTIDDNGNITIPSGKIVGGSRDADTYIVLNTENYLKVVTATGVIVVLPSSPSDWEEHIIKDGAGIAGSNPITISPSGTTIDGASSIQISANYGSVTTVYNGVEWSII